MRRCTHCSEPIESFNYVTRGPSWRHEKTQLIFCQTTVAEPMPQACPLCRCYEPDHAPTCLSALSTALANQHITTDGASDVA